MSTLNGTEYLLHLIIRSADSIYSGYSMGKSFYSPKSANVLWSLSSLLLHLSEQRCKWKYYIIFHLIASQYYVLHLQSFSHPGFHFIWKKPKATPPSFCLHWSFLKIIWNVRLPPVLNLSVLSCSLPMGRENLVGARAGSEFRQLLKVLNNLQQTLKEKWHGRGRMKYTSRVMMKSWSDAPYFSDQLIRWYIFKFERYIETQYVWNARRRGR